MERMTEQAAPDATKVWAVRLGAGPEDTEGVLSLEETDLVFAAEEGELRIPYHELQRVKRVLGSPVILIDRRSSEESERFAFFFSKPPALPGTEESKRKTRRRAVYYLGASNRERKALLKRWEREIRSRVSLRR